MLIETDAPSQVYAQPSYELVQAGTGKRLANYLIDVAFFYIVLVFWGVIIAIVSPSSIDALDESGNIFGSFTDNIISLIIYAVIMSLMEAIFRGKSIGKLITGTKAVNGDGSDITFSKAFARGFSRAVPFNAFSALGKPPYPWHDKWTRTYVIDEKETRRYNEQLQNI